MACLSVLCGESHHREPPLVSRPLGSENLAPSSSGFQFPGESDAIILPVWNLFPVLLDGSRVQGEVIVSRAKGGTVLPRLGVK